MTAPPPTVVEPTRSALDPAEVTRVAKRKWRLIWRAPATVTYVVLMWVAAFLSHSILYGPRAELLGDVGVSVHSFERVRLFTLISSAGWTSGLFGYLLATVLLGITGFFLERRWGAVRLLWVGLVTQTLGVALGLGVILALRQLGSEWAAELSSRVAIGPWPLLIGVLMAYSATAPALWRRRLRLGTIAVVTALTLYNGLLEDVLRLSGALVGLLLGSLVLAHAPYPRTHRSARREARATVAVLMLVSAIGPVLVALNNRAAGPLAVLRYMFVAPQIGPEGLARLCDDPSGAARCAELTRQLQFHGVGPIILSLLPSLLVVLLAYGLQKGRRFAWWAAVAVHLLLALLGLVMYIQALQHRRTPELRGVPFIEARSMIGQLTPMAVPLILLAVLLLTRWAFDIPAPDGTYKRLLRVLGISLVVLFAIYVEVGLMVADQFAPQPTLGSLIAEFPRRLAPPGYLGLIRVDFLPTTFLATVLFEWTGIALWTIVIGDVVRSFNAYRTESPARDAEDARAILEQNGIHALSYLTTWEGNSYWFNRSRTTFVAYRVQSGVAISMGDAIGPADDIAEAMSGFARHCAAHSWTMCFYSTTLTARRIGVELGWQSVQVAEEATLPLGKLAFTGKKFQDIRTAASRAAREGIVAEWISFPDAPWLITDQITAISEEWVATKGLPEMGFTLGGIDEIDDPAVRCLIAIDASRTIHGITSWLPVYRNGAPIGWTLDYMRRRSAGFKGVMEFLISTAALQFQQEGAEFVSLSGAPLARAEQGPTPTFLQRLLDRTGHRLEPVYGFRSLLAFKAKFQPEYQPIYLIYPEAAALPRIGNAISRAYLPHMSLSDGVRMMRKLRPRKEPELAER